MLTLIRDYWPHILTVISILVAVPAAIHAAMTKNEVRAAIGWVGVIFLSPIVGALIYAIGGINRIRHKSLAVERAAHGRYRSSVLGEAIADGLIAERFGRRFAALSRVGDSVTHHGMRTDNVIEMLESGDVVYAAMADAISQAKRSVILQSYIFDRDPAGLRIADALIEAAERGVAVRVLIDAIGVRYSRPSILGYLHTGGVTTALFNGKIIEGLRLPYANLRTHRKMLVVDGAMAFMGGMNIRQEFTQEFAGPNHARDTHFRVEGPVVADIFAVAAEDWNFATEERLEGDAWAVSPARSMAGGPLLARIVPSGPDSSLETSHKLLMGAFSVARHTIRIMSPYFLPDRELISALTTAARRGVEIDIVVPGTNNLTLVDRAMTAQFDQVLGPNCRIWRSRGSFDHSKLLTIDDAWSFVGSSNLDPRSLRLNFEIDLEVVDAGFASGVAARIDAAKALSDEVTRTALKTRPFPIRVIDRALWLGSPYL